MAVSPSQRGQLASKFRRLMAAKKSADEAVFVAIFEAAEAGVTRADIAHMIGDKSPTAIPAKVLKGKAILEARKRA